MTRSPAPRRAGRARSAGLAAAAFVALAAAVYAPSLPGAFFSDDLHYLVGNPYVRSLDGRRFAELLDPFGDAVARIENYAPVHQLLHAAGWALFGEDVRGHRALNIGVHALASLLLAAWLRRVGLPAAAAIGGAAFFLVHPANVEAVAWISQLKTPASVALALAALLLLERRPALSTLAFALALLAKPPAAGALAAAAVGLWARWPAARERPETRRAARWLGAWALVLGAFASVELAAFWDSNAMVEPQAAEPWVRFQSAVALVGRYAALALTGFGAAVFHGPAPVASLLDPWWLAGLAALALVGARALVALRVRSEEAACWAWAAVSYLPVSQVFPFPFPLADRYLYPILPGLIGGTLLAGRALSRRLPAPTPLRLRAAAAAACIALLALGARAHDRARLWGNPVLLLADSARRYPDGSTAHLLRARSALVRLDPDRALAELRAAFERGFDRYDQLVGDPAWQTLRGDPRFQALLADMGERWIRRLERISHPTQIQLATLATAHRLRGDLVAARRYLEAARARGGALDADLERDLRLLSPGAPGSP